MGQFIIEVILSFFAENIGGKILSSFFAAVYRFGIIGLKIVTLSGKSIEELDKEYKDSSKPYFMSFFVIVGFLFLLSA